MKLSIVIPTHNIPERGEFLQRSLDMLDRQTFRDFEIIITSTGLTMAENINAGIRQAKGELIKFLFMDDMLAHEDALQDIVDNFEGEWMFTASSNNLKPRYTDDIHLGNNKLGSPSALTILNRDSILFNESMTWLVDCDYYKLMNSLYGEPKIFDGVGVIIGEGPHQETNKIPQEVKDRELEYMKKNMLKLPNVTLIAFTGKDIEGHRKMLDKSCEDIEFGAIKLIESPSKDIDEWNRKILYELTNHVDTDFALLIHADSCVVNPLCWTDEFLQYDYIGAPWPEGSQPVRVGNGGFSLRSKKLLDAFNDLNLPFTDNGTGFFNEDGQICVYHREALEKAGIRFAPVELASTFSRELPCHDSEKETFGVHKYL